MILIKKIEIYRFRSILKLSFEVDNTLNLISICGENNVGKTNTLRAINLFFNPASYDALIDRPTLKHAQGGASIDPLITIDFFDTSSENYFNISRDFKQFEDKQASGLSGSKYKKNSTKKTNHIKLTEEDILIFLKNIEFRYIESVNINIPEIIEQLTGDVIDVEYDKTRFSKTRQLLKDAYEQYTSGLQEILDSFSSDISTTFQSFKENWNVNIRMPTSSDRFRDLISDDVDLHIDDKGCMGVEEKGSGLQRLAVILLNFEVLKRMKKKKNSIICVDEPDIYLHEGLQIKLKNFFEENSDKMQIFYTTHSRIFINKYSMKNIIFLGVNVYSQYSSRKKKDINVAETTFIDTTSESGYEKICEHLGIEKNNYDILSENNIIVEGGCDKKYMEELLGFFNIPKIKIIPLYGTGNAEKYLDFYNSYYKNNISEITPVIKVVFDNDNAGREAYKKIIKKIDKKFYNSIKVSTELLQNHLGSGNLKLEHNKTNNEVEDFLFPEIMCYLVNKILQKRSLNQIDSNDITEDISSPAFGQNGILSLIEHEKNKKNLQDGNIMSFSSSDQSTDDIKKGLADIFNISGDRNLLQLMNECDAKYPFVKEYLTELFTF